MAQQAADWTWHFDAPPSAIWPVMADTARFNEAAAVPKHAITETPQSDGSILFEGSLKLGPFRLHWRERPVNWVNEQWFEHCRQFHNGPLKSLCAHFTLEPSGNGKTGGTIGHYRLAVEPANLLGRLMLRAGFFRSSGKTFGRLAEEANRFARGDSAAPFAYSAPPPTAAVAARVRRMVAAIEESGNGHGLAQRLADLVLKAQEADLWHIRPLLLAREWRRPPLETIGLCLQAVRAGLLELRWDLLCPRCRVAKAWSGGLDRLPEGAHCPSCNIDYGRDFSRNVEASFRPAEAVRRLESGEYCLWGPMSTPHVKVQIALEPGESRTVAAHLPFGPYRLRTLEIGPECDIDWQAGGFPTLMLGANTVAAGDPAPEGTVRLENRGNRARVAIVESRAWVADALTADRVTALQAFRDLFSDDVLRPGDEVSIGRVTLLFSDLRGSTALYQKIGDANAYHLVRDHFAFMAKAIRDHEGAIVKTIGDAVMAAFARPEDGLAAAVAIQREVAAFNRAHPTDGGSDAIAIKLGLHQGPCIVVTLNERLDYFGSTVNLAARLQGQSKGGDIVLSPEIAADPAVAPMLERLAAEGVPAVPDQAALKGFVHPLPFHRLNFPGG
ncbi:MAG TPA: adenylate/guanylate cyclase domain-containing protein [Dongiaceae bacterium]|nr:adenylate/guanylate cyclase domain-containing protein [Dongiaceae bacterium]